MESNERFIIGAIVRNHFGVLTRVSSLFSRRGYNIESLVVGVTDDPQLSRMTIVACGGEQIKAQVVKQLGKLTDVVWAGEIPTDRVVAREHMLVKMKVEPGNIVAITDMINSFAAKVVDFCGEMVTVEVTGAAHVGDRFVEAAREFGILEICRAGAQALHRGSERLVEES